jgi:hypothetical protein
VTDTATSFQQRLQEIISRFPSRAALAKAAEIPPSSLQSYLEGTEPTRPVLIALAGAARVSLEWLADGHGYKEPHPPVPDGYVELPFYDVRKSNGYVYPLFTSEGLDSAFLKLDWFNYPGMNPGELITLAGTESFVSEITEGDFLVVDRTWRTTFANKPLSIPAGVYLTSRQAKLCVRRVTAVVGDCVKLVLPGNKDRNELVQVGDHGFTIHGRIIWYASRRMTAERTNKRRPREGRDRAQDKRPRQKDPLRISTIR